jgi:hypothetical protein
VELIECAKTCLSEGKLSHGIEAYRLACMKPTEEELIECGEKCLCEGDITQGMEAYELAGKTPTKEIFEKYTGIPDIYLGSFLQMSKLWKNTYVKLYGPWIESMQKLSRKMTEISRGDAGPEAYKEFYNMLMDTYQETYGKHIQSIQSSKDLFENFMQSNNIYLNMYKSWIAALEKMSKKAEELSKQTAYPEAYKEFYDLWIKMYEKAFDSFFEDMPMAGPMKEMMEPVKSMAKIYTDAFARMSKMWVKSYSSIESLT